MIILCLNTFSISDLKFQFAQDIKNFFITFEVSLSLIFIDL